MGSNDLLGKHCSLLSCSLTCRSGRSRPAETGCHLNGLWHEGGLSSYAEDGAGSAAAVEGEGEQAAVLGIDRLPEAGEVAGGGGLGGGRAARAHQGQRQQ